MSLNVLIRSTNITIQRTCFYSLQINDPKETQHYQCVFYSVYKVLELFELGSWLI